MPKDKYMIPTIATDEVRHHGLQLVNFSQIIKTAATQVPHRDENYIFIFQEKGKLHLELDFRKVMLKGCMVYFILPGQIHHFSAADDGIWMLTVEPSLVQQTYKSILDQYFLLHEPAAVSEQKKKKLSGCLSFLADEVRAPGADACQQHIKRGLLDVIIGIITREYANGETDKRQKESRSTTITRQFKALLFQYYKAKKKPSDYAGVLKISTPYLNEAVKDFTGFTVSYWIQKMIVMEAKRLLYYTDLTIKEIAGELGYDDHAYFSRLFTTSEKVSPLGYRKRHR